MQKDNKPRVLVRVSLTPRTGRFFTLCSWPTILRALSLGVARKLHKVQVTANTRSPDRRSRTDCTAVCSLFRPRDTNGGEKQRHANLCAFVVYDRASRFINMRDNRWSIRGYVRNTAKWNRNRNWYRFRLMEDYGNAENKSFVVSQDYLLKPVIIHRWNLLCRVSLACEISRMNSLNFVIITGLD